MGDVNTLNHAFQPAPFGNDLYALFGNAAALPIVGNFDPPTTSSLPSSPDMNSMNPLDVNNDGVVSPIDALLVINQINTGASDQLIISTFTVAVAPFLDVNGDRVVTPIDALLVINHINAYGVGDQAEGESTAADAYFSAVGSGSNDFYDTELWSLLATDTNSQNSRKR
jgi:Dockerin type I domain